MDIPDKIPIISNIFSYPMEIWTITGDWTDWATSKTAFSVSQLNTLNAPKI